MRKIFLSLLVFIASFFFFVGPAAAAEEVSCRITSAVTRRPSGSYNLGVSINTTQLTAGTSYSIVLDTGIRDTVNHAFTPVAGGNGVNFAFELDSGHGGNTYTLYVRPTSCVDVAGTSCAVSQCSQQVTFSESAPLTPEDPSSEIVLPSNAPSPAPRLSTYEFCKQIPGEAERAECEACLGDPEVREKIYTAIGCIDTSQSGLAADLIRLFLSVAGGLAFLSMLFAGATFATSQGDTNKVKQAKDLLTASVSGLFFIIFSTILLHFIGVEILQIPGLG